MVALRQVLQRISVAFTAALPLDQDLPDFMFRACLDTRRSVSSCLPALSFEFASGPSVKQFRCSSITRNPMSACPFCANLSLIDSLTLTFSYYQLCAEPFHSPDAHRDMYNIWARGCVDAAEYDQ